MQQDADIQAWRRDLQISSKHVIDTIPCQYDVPLARDWQDALEDLPLPRFLPSVSHRDYLDTNFLPPSTVHVRQRLL